MVEGVSRKAIRNRQVKSSRSACSPMMLSSLKTVRVLLLSLSCLLFLAVIHGQNDEAPNATMGASDQQSSESDSEVPKRPTTAARSKNEPDFDTSSTDWGSYYDPQSIFCGKFDCYKILGFDYESFGRNPPDTKTITKRYRSLSRVWHPDKNKRRDAKSRFVKIARAYEVLTDKVLRKEYDDMRYDQEMYYQKYGTSVLWNYAPKSDVTIVLLIILVIGNIFSWYSQKHRWQLVADRLIKAAVEDWTPSQGGTPESKHLREDALEALAQHEKEMGINGSAEEKSSSQDRKKNKGVKKLSLREKKLQEQEALTPIVREIVYQMDDFGGGFHKPTWRDLLIVTLMKLPFSFGREMMWFSKYWVRRMQKLPLNDDERLVLTKRAVGPIPWETASEKDRETWVKRELWIVSNLAEWSEEQELSKLSTSERKAYLQLKKKGLLEKEE